MVVASALIRDELPNISARSKNVEFLDDCKGATLMNGSVVLCVGLSGYE